jgi:hypothetical protein
MEAQRAGNRGSIHSQQGDDEGQTGSRVLALLAVLLAGGITLGWAGTSWSENAPEAPFKPFSAQLLATFQSGRITGVHGTTVQIDQRDYELRPDVEIQNPEGNLMEAHDIRKSALAKFHLKQGRIDMLVVILPD